MGLVDFFYKAGQTFFSMIPKGEYVINVLLPYCWLFFGTGTVVVVQVWWGILVFSDETSRVTRSVPSGMLFKDCSLVMKLVMSLMKEVAL